MKRKLEQHTVYPPVCAVEDCDEPATFLCAAHNDTKINVVDWHLPKRKTDFIFRTWVYDNGIKETRYHICYEDLQKLESRVIKEFWLTGKQEAEPDPDKGAAGKIDWRDFFCHQDLALDPKTEIYNMDDDENVSDESLKNMYEAAVHLEMEPLLKRCGQEFAKRRSVIGYDVMMREINSQSEDEVEQLLVNAMKDTINGDTDTLEKLLECSTNTEYEEAAQTIALAIQKALSES